MNTKILLNQLKNSKAASRKLRSSSIKDRNRVLRKAAELLLIHQSEILKANRKDLRIIDLPKKTAHSKAEKQRVNSAFRDRLLLNPTRIEHMANSLEQVALLSDPVGEVVDQRVLQNGLQVKKVRGPLGIILMIFESRPNVAVEAFSLAFKSGNVILLKGGKESWYTTRVLYKILKMACEASGFSKHSFWGIEDSDRTITQFLLRQSQWIDVVVPRGGDRLIEFVTKTSKIPIIKNDRGLCHIYVHEDADLNMTKQLIMNAKTQRPGVCNAMETLLVHEAVAAELLPALYSLLMPFCVEWRACPTSFRLLKTKVHVKKATQKDWDREYLDFILNCRIVRSVDEAIEHIDLHSSKHSEAIVTSSETTAKRFQSEVDSAVVYWNASTRFTDGFALGLGGELGISTQKLHVRGPVGLRELTSVRWVIDGNGQVRS